MALLGKIRSLGPVALISVIGLALFAFVFSTGSGTITDIFKADELNQNSIATVNGMDIERVEFMTKVENLQRQSGGSLTTTQAMNRAWDNEVRSKIMQSQYDALGLSVERDYMRDLLEQNLGAFEEFKNEAGLFDEDKLNEFIANLKAIAPETSTLGGSAVNYKSWTDFEQNVAVT